MTYTSFSAENIYEGGFSSLNPDYGNFIGYRLNAGTVGFPGSPQTANQLAETANALKQGVKSFEVTLLTPDVVEGIPKQHFKEMRALMKLSGVKPSVHAPMVDPVGFGERGWEGDETRKNNERKLFESIEKAHELDPKGNIPIVIHSSGGAGKQFIPGDTEKGEERFLVQEGALINKETGQLVPVKREYLYRLGHPEELDKKGTLFSVEHRTASMNNTEWDNELVKIAELKKQTDEIMAPAMPFFNENKNIRLRQQVIEDENGNKKIKIIDVLDADNKHKELSPETIELYNNQIGRADIFRQNAELALNTAFNKAYKYGTDKQKKELKKLSEDYAKLKDFKEGKDFSWVNEKEGIVDVPITNVLKERNILEEITLKFQKITDGGGNAPKIYEDAEKFATSKAAETFGNLALKSYKQWGEHAPIIAIENMYQGMGFSKPEDLQKLIKQSREVFAKKLQEEKHISENKAQEIAEKHIGITLDVGHLNIFKKTGFTDKDLIEQTKKIAKDVKHLHLTDNFGFNDSHLAPGMGNVPFKKILEELEKTGQLDKMRKIVEAGGFVKEFKKSPHSWTLSAFGSPIYGAKMQSYWQNSEQVAGYFGGYGTINPQQHHTMYGSGFTTMPMELGGNIPGEQSRFSGNNMA